MVDDVLLTLPYISHCHYKWQWEILVTCISHCLLYFTLSLLFHTAFYISLCHLYFTLSLIIHFVTSVSHCLLYFTLSPIVYVFTYISECHLYFTLSPILCIVIYISHECSFLTETVHSVLFKPQWINKCSSI